MFLELLWTFLGKIMFFTGTIGTKNSFPKPLSKEEEEYYLSKVAQGDKDARDTLVKHNMRLVAHIVKKYTGAAEADDLISVGSIGLIKAIGTYKPGHSTTLATYTARCIENEILMLIRANKKHKNTLSLSDLVGVDKDGNELTLMDLLFEKEDSVFEQVERSVQREKRLEQIKDILSDPMSCLTFSEKLKFSQDFKEKLLREDIEEYLEGYTEEQFENTFGYQKSFAEENIQDIVKSYQKKRCILEDESDIFYESVFDLKNELQKEF